jgi:NADPH:quinone reductase-like Zn-dependent oxidoreductase
MKAFFYESFGGPSVMRVGELPDPGPREQDVLVDVRAASVNPLDFKMRSGALRMLVGRGVPRITGADFAGEVVVSGADASALRPGERVFGFTNAFARQQGAHAKRVAVPARQVRRMPQGLSFEEAAALPCAGLTAVAGLMSVAPLEGRTVLVNGATGGVGHLATLIARAYGARVVARTSARNVDLAHHFGADEVLAREDGPLALLGRTFDIVFDAWGHLTYSEAAPALARGGTLLTTLPTPSLGVRTLLSRLFGGHRVSFSNLLGRDEHWTELIRLVDTQELRPHIGATFSLDDAAKAVAAVEDATARGKIVIRVS